MNTTRRQVQCMHMAGSLSGGQPGYSSGLLMLTTQWIAPNVITLHSISLSSAVRVQDAGATVFSNPAAAAYISLGEKGDVFVDTMENPVTNSTTRNTPNIVVAQPLSCGLGCPNSNAFDTIYFPITGPNVLTVESGQAILLFQQLFFAAPPDPELWSNVVIRYIYGSN